MTMSGISSGSPMPSVAALSFSAEQDELRSMVRKFLASRSSEHDVRRLMATEAGYDEHAWKTLASLGITGLLIPQRYGGVGASVVDMQIVCEEMGAALMCAPFLASSVLATAALLASGDELAMQRYLPDLAQGSIIASLAIAEDDGSWSTAHTDTRALRHSTHADSSYLLAGTKSFVLDGLSADLLLVVAASEHGPSLFAVQRDAHGLSISATATMDATRKLSQIVLADTPAKLVGEEGAGRQYLSAAMDVAVAALAAEQAGGTRRVLEMAVEYALLRQQFGRPIGSFQAIKHKCADMALQAECSVSAAYAVGWALDADTTEAPMLASLAKAFCSDAFYRCAADNIQIHGGIGFTWEHPAHLYFKRATSSALLFGASAEYREQLLNRAGL